MNSNSAFLYIDSLQCIRQRDLALDGDTPYLLIFAGLPGAQSESDVMRVNELTLGRQRAVWRRIASSHLDTP